MKQQRSFDSVAKDVRLAQRGDAPAMERILADVQDMVYYNCLRMLRKEQSAQDAAQDVLITVYRKIGTLSDPTAYFGWVKRITANHCKNLLCKVNREFLLSETEDGEDPFASFTDTDEQRIPDKALDNAESRRMVNEIVDALPDEQRMCVMLYYYDEMKTHEIADALSVSEGTVKSRLNYARKRIRMSVDALAQQGVKLYGGMPLPFLGHILRESVSAAPALAGKIAAAAAATAAAGASAAAATGASAAAATGTAAGLGAFFASVMGKVVIAAVAVAVLGGASVGVAGIVQNRQAAAAQAAAAPTVFEQSFTAAPTGTPVPTATPEPPDPVETVRSLTALPEEEASYLVGEIGRILGGENDLGLAFSSPIVKIWEIRSLSEYLAFRETDAWKEDVPESALACYGVQLLDGTVLYVFLGDGRGAHPWEIYSVYLPEQGIYLLQNDYLSGPQWTAWSEEQPPEDALEVKTAQGWRSRQVGSAEKDYRGYRTRRRPKRRRTNTLPDSATRLRRCTGLQTKRLPSKPWTEPMRCGSTTTWGIRGHGTPAFPARSGIRGGISTGIRNSRGI